MYSKSITRSRSREIKMTRRICFRLAGDTGVADMFIAGGSAIAECSQSQLSRRFGIIEEQSLGQSLYSKMLNMIGYLGIGENVE